MTTAMILQINYIMLAYVTAQFNYETTTKDYKSYYSKRQPF